MCVCVRACGGTVAVAQRNGGPQQDEGKVSLRFDEWSFVVRVHPIAPGSKPRDMTAIASGLHKHMHRLERSQYVITPTLCGCGCVC